MNFVHIFRYICVHSIFIYRCLDTAETCKFSHGNLTDVTRNILLKHLEAAPKEILGDFPRLTREAAVTLVFQTEAKNKGWLEDEGKTVEEIQKSVGDAIIEEAKKQLPRKSRWGDPTPTGRICVFSLFKYI